MTDQPIDKLPHSDLPIVGLVIGILGLFCPVFVPSLIAAVIGHVALGRIRRDEIDSAGKGAAIGALIAGYLGMIAVTTILIAAATILPPALRQARSKAQLTVETSNLRQLGLALMMYAEDSKGVYPPDLATLAETGYLPPGPVYVSPGKGTPPPSTAAQIRSGANCDYVFLMPGRKLTSIEHPGKTVVVHGDPFNFHHAIVILFADGHVETDEKTNVLDLAAGEHGWIVPNPDRP